MSPFSATSHSLRASLQTTYYLSVLVGVGAGVSDFGDSVDLDSEGFDSEEEFDPLEEEPRA